MEDKKRKHVKVGDTYACWTVIAESSTRKNREDIFYVNVNVEHGKKSPDRRLGKGIQKVAVVHGRFMA